MFFCFCAGIINAQQKAFSYKNQNLSIDKRVDDLLKQLTTEEKISFVRI